MIKVDGNAFIVTGGLGFIGYHIVEELNKQNKTVYVIDNTRNPTFMDRLIPSTRVKYFDINLASSFRDIPLPTAFDNVAAVFHNACSKNTVCLDDPHLDLLTNAWGSFKIFNLCSQEKIKVVHASTGSVYGDRTYKGTKDDWDGPLAPKSFYGVSKLAGEQYLRAFKEYYGLKFVALRYFHVYGPRQDNGPNGGVVAIFISKILKGEPITVYGDGNQVRSFTFVKDVVRANFLSAGSKEMEGEFYNVASGLQIKLNDLIEYIQMITGKIAKIEYVPAKKGDIRDFNVANYKIAYEGMEDWTPFKDGLRETIDWYKYYVA